LTNWVFNSSSMVAGQRIFAGGSWDSSSATFTPDLISLRRQGVVGVLVPNSVAVTNGNQGSFQLQNTGLMWWVAQAAFTVNPASATNFINTNGPGWIVECRHGSDRRRGIGTKKSYLRPAGSLCS